MSAHANVLQTPNLEEATARPVASSGLSDARIVDGWSPAAFARQQISGLVRRVFFSSSAHPARQVVMCGAEPGLDLMPICELLGRELALEAGASVAVVGNGLASEQRVAPTSFSTRGSGTSLRQVSIQAAVNLWHVPNMRSMNDSQECPAAMFWQTQMADLRREFDYSIISAAPASKSSDPALMAQLADGVILVIEAHNTRRAIARKTIEMLEAAQLRILGIVLSERTFPLPEWLYRRL